MLHETRGKALKKSRKRCLKNQEKNKKKQLKSQEKIKNQKKFGTPFFQVLYPWWVGDITRKITDEYYEGHNISLAETFVFICVFAPFLRKI